MAYDLNEQEKQFVALANAAREQYGGLVAMHRNGDVRVKKNDVVRIDYLPIPGGQYALGPHGRVWRFYRAGTSRDPLRPGQGSPWRNDHIEMWSGHWRRVQGPDGEVKYAKRLVPISLGRNVNKHPGASHIDWYTTVKGYRHPYDPPHKPSASQIRVLEGRLNAERPVIYARMEEELNKAVAAGEIDPEAAEEIKAEARGKTITQKKAKKAKKSKKRPKRSNRRAAG